MAWEQCVDEKGLTRYFQVAFKAVPKDFPDQSDAKLAELAADALLLGPGYEHWIYEDGEKQIALRLKFNDELASGTPKRAYVTGFNADELEGWAEALQVMIPFVREQMDLHGTKYWIANLKKSPVVWYLIPLIEKYCWELKEVVNSAETNAMIHTFDRDPEAKPADEATWTKDAKVTD